MGSPPHRRGKGRDGHPGQPPPGITPAWAGKSSGCRYALTSEWDHPRVGGEKDCKKKLTHSLTGSPPRGRGKGHGCHQTAVVVGITPAWAGKRSQVAAALQSGWDHPRVGGEKCRGAPAATLPPGSPPHGRGKAFSVLRRQFRFRITPAWAGKRSSGPAFPSPRWNHPRMGGEKYDCTGQEFTNWGSPPRRRGKEQPHH